MPRWIALGRTAKLFFAIQRRAALHGYPLGRDEYRGFRRGWRDAWRRDGGSRPRGADRAFFREVRRRAGLRWSAQAGGSADRAQPFRPIRQAR